MKQILAAACLAVALAGLPAHASADSFVLDCGPIGDLARCNAIVDAARDAIPGHAVGPVYVFEAIDCRNGSCAASPPDTEAIVVFGSASWPLVDSVVRVERPGGSLDRIATVLPASYAERYGLPIGSPLPIVLAVAVASLGAFLVAIAIRRRRRPPTQLANSPA